MSRRANKVGANKTTGLTANAIAAFSVRNNTSLENLHAGSSPISKTGDYSDVKVIDAEGNEIPWNKLSRLNDDEMKTLMKEISSNIYTMLVYFDHPAFKYALGLAYMWSAKWDLPKLRKNYLHKEPHI